MAASMLLSAAIAAVYLIWAPPSADLAAQTFRADLFADHGFVATSEAWYGGFKVPGYSVLYPPLAAWFGIRVVGAAAAIASAGLFGALARRRFGDAALVGSVWFAAGVSAWLFTGRMTFLLGVAVGLGALLAADHRRPVVTAILAALSALASPVAGLFVGLAGVAVGLAGDRVAGAALAAPPAVAILALNLAYPTGGEAAFVFSSFISVPLLVVAALWLVPPEQRALRIGLVLYGLLAVIAFAIPNPLGGNVVRLGALFAGPVAALVLWRRPLVLALVAAPLVYWQLNAPVDDTIDGVGDPSTEREFHQPLLDELDRQTAGPGSVRVQIPPTDNRWEAAYVAPRYPLARGWLRQLESDDFDLFDHGNLTPDAYRAWLEEHEVDYVAVPRGVELDYLARDEVELIAGGLDYLEPEWQNGDWRLYRVAA